MSFTEGIGMSIVVLAMIIGIVLQAKSSLEEKLLMLFRKMNNTKRNQLRRGLHQ